MGRMLVLRSPSKIITPPFSGWEIEFYIQLKLEQRILADCTIHETQALLKRPMRIVSEMMMPLSMIRHQPFFNLDVINYSEPLWAASAYVEILLENWLVAGDLLAVLSQSDPKYALEATTMYQRVMTYPKHCSTSLALDSEEKSNRDFLSSSFQKV